MAWENPYLSLNFIIGLEIALLAIGLALSFWLSRRHPGTKMHWLKLFALFFVFYNALYLVSQTSLIYKFDSPMLFALPIIGFFMVCLICEFASGHYETNLKTNIYFPLLFVVLCFIAYWLQLYVYFGNISYLSGQSIPFDFFGELRNSPFLVFVLAGLLGWLASLILEKTKKSA